MNLKKIAATYRENEAYNLHSENLVLLAKHFGTEEQLELARKFHRSQMKRGYMLNSESDSRYELHCDLWKKAVEAGFQYQPVGV